jgi:hypothetical protein
MVPKRKHVNLPRHVHEMASRDGMISTDLIGGKTEMCRSLSVDGIELLERIIEIQKSHPSFCNQFVSQPRVGMAPWEIVLREFYICAGHAADNMMNESQIPGWCMLSIPQQQMTRERCVLTQFKFDSNIQAL